MVEGLGPGPSPLNQLNAIVPQAILQQDTELLVSTVAEFTPRQRVHFWAFYICYFITLVQVYCELGVNITRV